MNSPTISVIPLAGASSRFTKAGLGPKHAAELGGATTFDWVTSSFVNYQESNFIFVTNNDVDSDFVHDHAPKLGIKNYRVVIDASYQGYCTAVYNGLKGAGFDTTAPMLTLPIDTMRPNFQLPTELERCNFYELCITGATNAERLNGYVSKPWLLKEPPPGHTTLEHRFRTYPLPPFRRGTGLNYFTSADSFIKAFESTHKDDKGATAKVGEWREWIRIYFKVSHDAPFKLRLVNRTDVIIVGREDEYKLVQKNWPSHLKLMGPK